MNPTNLPIVSSINPANIYLETQAWTQTLLTYRLKYERSQCLSIDSRMNFTYSLKYKPCNIYLQTQAWTWTMFTYRLKYKLKQYFPIESRIIQTKFFL